MVRIGDVQWAPRPWRRPLLAAPGEHPDGDGDSPPARAGISSGSASWWSW